MAATAGSLYQIILTNHINNIPPNCDPQRSSEGFLSYFNRMAAQGLPPDIGADESDALYLVRLASYAIPTSTTHTNVTASNGLFNVSMDMPYSTSLSPLSASVATGSTYLYSSASINLLYVYNGTAWHSASLA
jgi:hypothetical protein